MKNQNLLTIALLFFTTTIFSQTNNHNISAPHGGILKHEKKYVVEMVTDIKSIRVYIYDIMLKPILNDVITGNVVFCYTYDACINKVLQPNGNEGFIVLIENPQYYYTDINLKIRKEIITVKFNNQMLIAD